MDPSIDVNQVLIVGHIFHDPELHHTRKGMPFLKLRVKTVNSFTSEGGRTKQLKSNHNVIVWGNKGQWFYDQVKKGSRVMITGNLQNRSYEKDGRAYWSTQLNAEMCACLDPVPGSFRVLDEQDENEAFIPNLYQ